MLAFQPPKSMLANYCMSCLFFLITFTAMPVSAQTSEIHLKQGDIFYRQFNNRNALTSYKKALETQPNNFDYLSKIVRAYNDIGEDLSSEESEQYYEQAVQYAEKLQQMFPDRRKAITSWLSAMVILLSCGEARKRSSSPAQWKRISARPWQ